MTTKRHRGRPKGHTLKKAAVLRAIADAAVDAAGEAFVLAPAVRRALGANGCHVHDSAVRDHGRSYRRDEVALLDAARQRRRPAAPAPERGPAAKAGPAMAEHVERMMRFYPLQGSTQLQARLGMLCGAAKPLSTYEASIERAEREWTKRELHDKLHPDAAMIHNMRQRIESRRFVDDVRTGMFSRADFFKI
jgi:hypothetical protein